MTPDQDHEQRRGAENPVPGFTGALPTVYSVIFVVLGAVTLLTSRGVEVQIGQRRVSLGGLSPTSTGILIGLELTHGTEVHSVLRPYGDQKNIVLTAPSELALRGESLPTSV